MLDEINHELSRRLNISSKIFDDSDSKKYITFNLVKSKFFKNQISEYIIPSQLKTDIFELVSKTFFDLNQKQGKTKFEQALFIPTLLFNNILASSDDDSESLLYDHGYQLSKEFLISVMSPYDLFKVKNMLVNNRIIDYSKYEDGSFYSKENKLALKYILNSKYKNLPCEVIENKYAARFELLVRNGLVGGTKRKTIMDSFLPFNSFEKNLQYGYQKNMFFDKTHFLEIFLKRHPNGLDVLNGNVKTTKEDNREIHLEYSYLLSLNSHTFKCSESYGRIYMPFQYISKEYREAIRIGNNEELIEAFDIHCCFVNLSARTIKMETDNEDLRKECDDIIELTMNDIYNDILKFNNLKNFKRSEIKKQVMIWLFSSYKDKIFFIEKLKSDIKYVDDYFKEKFKLFYDFVNSYSVLKKKVIKNKRVVEKKISELSMKCFQYESNIMFENILPMLHNDYKNIPFVSLHDAVYIPKRFYSYKDEIKNKILNKLVRL